jgi:hypothetical protein
MVDISKPENEEFSAKSGTHRPLERYCRYQANLNPLEGWRGFISGNERSGIFLF